MQETMSKLLDLALLFLAGCLMGFLVAMLASGVCRLVSVLGHLFEKPPVKGWKPVWIRHRGVAVPAWLCPQNGEVHLDGNGVDILDKIERAVRRPKSTQGELGEVRQQP